LYQSRVLHPEGFSRWWCAPWFILSNLPPAYLTRKAGGPASPVLVCGLIVPEVIARVQKSAFARSGGLPFQQATRTSEAAPALALGRIGGRFDE
jgi:hypothetical protein